MVKNICVNTKIIKQHIRKCWTPMNNSAAVFLDNSWYWFQCRFIVFLDLCVLYPLLLLLPLCSKQILAHAHICKFYLLLLVTYPRDVCVPEHTSVVCPGIWPKTPSSLVTVDMSICHFWPIKQACFARRTSKFDFNFMLPTWCISSGAKHTDSLQWIYFENECRLNTIQKSK